MIQFLHGNTVIFNPFMDECGQIYEEHALMYGFEKWILGDGTECMGLYCQGKGWIFASLSGGWIKLSDISDESKILLSHSLPSEDFLADIKQRKFEMHWGESFGSKKNEVKDWSFISVKNGYTALDTLEIEMMGVGETWRSNEYPDHTATRIF